MLAINIFPMELALGDYSTSQNAYFVLNLAPSIGEGYRDLGFCRYLEIYHFLF